MADKFRCEYCRQVWDESELDGSMICPECLEPFEEDQYDEYEDEFDEEDGYDENEFDEDDFSDVEYDDDYIGDEDDLKELDDQEEDY